MIRRAPGIFVALLLLVAASTAVYVLHRSRTPSVRAGLVNTIPQDIGGPFELVDSHGRAVSDRTYRGKWLLIYFGYTHCPDVCPTTLNEIAETLSTLGSLAGQIQPLFITVDPDRDTPQVLADYTAAFDSRIVGLTGTAEQIAVAAKEFHINYQKRQVGDDYYMDHTSIIHVVEPDGTYARFFFSTDGSHEMVRVLRQLIEAK